MKKIVTIPFTANFIDALADFIIDQYVTQGKDLNRLLLVFGGKRPSVFLRRALALRIKKPFFPPQTMTIDELMERIIPDQGVLKLTDLDHAYVMFELTKAYAPEILKGREHFVRFLPWAREIIKFIEQLDIQDAHADALRILKEHAQIGFQVPMEINRLLELLMVLRKHYHAYLEEHQLTSRGFTYLKASQNISSVSFDGFDKIIFCNFFYLHRTELKVISHLCASDQAMLFLQGDQRRWPALKRIAQEIGEDILEGQEIAPTDFNLKVYGAFDSHAQAEMAGEILKQVPDPVNAVIVLPSVEALLPLWTSIPKDLGDFNISIGYPLKRSSLYSLIELIVQAQKTVKGQRYYTRDYLRVLRHPMIKNMQLDGQKTAAKVLIHTLEQVLSGFILSEISGQIFISLADILKDDILFDESQKILQKMDEEVSVEQLRDIAKNIHFIVFEEWERVRTFAALAGVLNHFLLTFTDEASVGVYPMNQFLKERLKEITGEWQHARFKDQHFDRSDILEIMCERLSREIIAFSGSPLRGLQVLGLLETRSLSFDDVIVLDVNEGVLPSLSIYEPLIPREVMIKMNMDHLELEEEIQRYQFMRLVSSAKRVHLIYQERPEKERSRFLEELIWEQEQRQGKVDSVGIIRPAYQQEHVPYQRIAYKTPEMMAFLKNFTFSATSINTYIENPYAFYQNYVLGLREQDNLLDDMQGRHIGTFVHGLLEQALKPYIGKKPVMDEDFARRLFDIFEKEFHQRFVKSGRNDAFLTYSVLEQRLRRFCEVESKRVALEVKELLFIERKFEDRIPLSCGEVRFSFRVDRVERLNDGTILIIDYKTGTTDAMPSHFDLLKPLGSFQMPLYLYYLHKAYPNESCNAALYHLQTMRLEKFITARKGVDAEALMGQFMVALDHVMVEIFNLEKPFIDAGLGIK